MQPKCSRLVLLRTALLCLCLGGGPATAAEPAGGHRLAAETSPYLQQHADNPVEWYPWGEEAFAAARREDRFIFLSIGYSTCFWCHVMKRESFADPAIAELLGRYAVSIKVDREERPDVDAIYTAATQLMAGHSGWPMTLLLTPDLEPFFAATYLPRDQLEGLLTEAHALWTTNRPAAEAQAARVTAAVRHATSLAGTPLERLPALSLVERATARLRDRFDPFMGGFDEAPKFPMPSILELLLTHHAQTGDPESLEMATVTLDAMAAGGIHDQVGGGFHRYAVDNHWRVPHFEKMLYDNAQLLHVYARAHALTGRPLYARVARGIAGHVVRDMRGSDGLFYSALDAEVDEEEGKSYLWTPAELGAVLSGEEYALARRVWDLDGPPNFEGAWILYWPRSHQATAEAMDTTVPALLDRLAPVRAKLLAARAKRDQPARDEKVITAWNAQMIWALAYAGEVLDEPAYVDMATESAAALLATLGDGDGLHRVARDGRARLHGYLDDHAATVVALAELHRVTGEERWLARARGLADHMVATFRDPAGGLHYAPPAVDHLLVRPKTPHDGAMPAGNSLAVRALVALAPDDEARYAGHAAAVLRAYGPLLEQAPDDLPHLLWGLAGYRAAGLPEDAAPPAVAAAPAGTAARLQATARLDGTDRLVTTLHLPEGWHVNATPASLDFLVPTRVTVRAGGEPVAAEVEYPPGREVDTGLGSPIRVYDDGEQLIARLTRAPAGVLEVTVHGQACSDDGRCLAPAEVRADLEDPGDR